MKALISTIEQRETGYRVADVHTEGFEVADAFFWVDCTDDVIADQFWYDPADETIKLIPEPVPEVAGENQPITQGAQTL